MSLLTASPAGAGIVCSVSDVSFHNAFCHSEPQSYRKSHEKAPDKIEKVSAEVKVLTNVQGFCEYLEEKGYETAVIASIPKKITPDSLTAVRDYQELTKSPNKKTPDSLESRGYRE